MMVQRLGPISPPASQVSTACNQISPSLQRAMNAANLNIPPSDTRSLISRESLASTTLSLTESQSALSVKQEWSHGYRALPSLSSSHGSQNGIDLGDLLSLPPGTPAPSNSVSNSLPPYLFGMENSHSPYASPRHSSARSHSARSKKRALSLSPLSDGIGIDFNTIIRTSPTSLVAYINGSRASPANMSPQPEVYGHFLGVRGSCIPQPCPVPGGQKGVLAVAGGGGLAYGEAGALEYERMQQLEHGGLQPGLVNNMVVQHGLPGPDGQQQQQQQPAAGLLKTERLEDFPGVALDLAPAPALPPLPPPQGPPPPYHAHPHLHHPELVPPPHAQPLALPQAALNDDGDGEDAGGKHCCRWIDCSALYDQQEELVRHIEKVHIDQRKGEDFTCFWAGCPRRYKPFNARYKLLIHMRVHSGEKPNKSQRVTRLEGPACFFSCVFGFFSPKLGQWVRGQCPRRWDSSFEEGEGFFNDEWLSISRFSSAKGHEPSQVGRSICHTNNLGKEMPATLGVSLMCMDVQEQKNTPHPTSKL
uniref:C2H2-type domain-containing protein n=1 Tax=Microcebus murinus TaxID=30608 RepID=A0A8C5VLN0_MICMU